MKKIDISILLPHCSFEQSWRLHQILESVSEMDMQMDISGYDDDANTRCECVIRHLVDIAELLQTGKIEEDDALSLISGDCFYLYIKETSTAALNNCSGLVVCYTNGGFSYLSFINQEEFEVSAKTIQDIGKRLAQDQSLSYDILTANIANQLNPTIH